MANSRQRRAARRAAERTLPERKLNRFQWFRWFMGQRKLVRNLSGGGGLALALWLAYEALGKELDGAVKTAAVMFFAAWAVFAFALYISDWWNKYRVLTRCSIVIVLIGAVLFWWAYLASPPVSILPPAPTPTPSPDVSLRFSSAPSYRLVIAGAQNESPNAGRGS